MTVPSVVAVASTTTAGVLALTFTESDPLVVIAAITALILTAGGVIVNIIVAWRTSSKVDVNTKMTEETAKVAADVKVQANVIEGHVNSAATRDASIIASQEKQLAMLRDTIAKLEQIAALRDQVQAITMSHTAPPPPPAQAAPVLNKIETNTADTAANTARTESVVQDLKDQK